MSRFSQLAGSSDLQKQSWDVKSTSELYPGDENNCSNSIKKSKDRKSRASKRSTESIQSRSTDTALKNDIDGLYIEPCGFRNVRNSCFLNASLQLLLNIPTLCSTLYKFRGICVSSAESAFHASGVQGKKTPLTDQLLELIEKLNPQVVENETILNNTSQCCNGYGNKNDNIDNNVIYANKTRVGSNSNSPVPSTYKLSQSNGVQPFMLKHLITPNPIFGKLLHMNTGFQEDAAECLTYLLTQLHEELGCTAVAKSTDVHLLNNTDQSQNDSEWIVTGRAGKHFPEARKIELDGGQSPIASLFCGTLVTRSNLSKSDNSYNVHNYSTVNSHAKKSAIKEPFFMLHVPIDNPLKNTSLLYNHPVKITNLRESLSPSCLDSIQIRVNSVESALRYLAELEVIADYHNSSDSQISLVRRRSMIDRLPPYLIIQLKRFYNESKVKNVQNINTSVNKFNSTTSQTSVIIRKHLKSVNIQSKLLIPKELLNQETHFSHSQRNYRLQAVIFHVGETVESGHYTIAVRITNPLKKSNSNSSTFIYFDDDRACVLNNAESINLLLTTHHPLDTRNCVFLHLKKPKTFQTNPEHVITSSSSNQHHSALNVSINHPRTPYILLYESQIGVHSDT
uniref:ubiquitinyl hydrolase 1 n=1 Tax=Schistosoma haematobium TaxID=6185 RepID=A0A095ANR0_SCHHA